MSITIPQHALIPGVISSVRKFLSANSSSPKFLPEPVLEGRHLLRSPEEVPDQIVGGHGTAGLENGLTIAHGNIAREQVPRVELRQEIFRDYFVPHVGVIGRRVARQMVEAGIHMPLISILG